MLGWNVHFLGKFSAISQPSISLADLRSQVLVKKKQRNFSGTSLNVTNSQPWRSKTKNRPATHKCATHILRISFSSHFPDS